MSEFIDSLQQHLKERVTSPLGAAFLVSWCVINYKLWVILFSDVKPWVKFGLIQNQVYPDFHYFLLLCFIAPSVSAAAYILAYPYPARWAMAYTTYQRRITRTAKWEAEQLIPLTRKEVDAEIAPLKQRINDLKAENNTLEAEYDKAAGAFRKEQEKAQNYAAELSDTNALLAKANQEIEQLNSRILDFKKKASEFDNKKYLATHGISGTSHGGPMYKTEVERAQKMTKFIKEKQAKLVPPPTPGDDGSH